MRGKLIAGNWKMNTILEEASRLASDVARRVEQQPGVEVAVCPPFISLEAVAEMLRDTPIQLGAQNMHPEPAGAFTGEVSPTMLLSVGCRYVILGHSERRQYFGETDELVNRKTRSAVNHGLVPILCIGETLEERERGEELAVVRRQLLAALEGVRPERVEALVIAYEPVWAIGTGRNATPDQAQEMHAAIREWLGELYGPAQAGGIRVLYGGSMKPDNARELLQQPDIDGGLIGGASLKADSFAAIAAAAR